MTEQLAFMRQNMEQGLTDIANIYFNEKTPDGRGGKTDVRTLWNTFPCRVTRPLNRISETQEGLSPHTEERWDISFSATFMEDNNIHILKNWEIDVRGITYIVLSNDEGQTDEFLYHVTVERLR